MRRDLALLYVLLLSPTVFAQDTSLPDSSLDSSVFFERLSTLATSGEGKPSDCGSTLEDKPEASVTACAEAAFQKHKPFYVSYRDLQFRSGLLNSGYGLAGDSAGNVFIVLYDIRPFPAVVADRHTRLFNANHIRVVDCIKPITLTKTKHGLLVCITPVNQEESAKAAAQQVPIETTICDVVQNPSAFNNKLVRLRGEVSGNFEYSSIGSSGCNGAGSLWFGYGGEGGPPGLAIYVGGSARPGAHDEEGKLVLPIPITIVKDAKFERFEKQMDARIDADSESSKNNGEFVMHCVTATFVGRIDAVSNEVHEFRKTKNDPYKSDGLGFGHMGHFEAQFMLKSVEDYARIGVCD